MPPPALQCADLRKLPVGSEMLLARADWSWCALEHSRIGAIELAEDGAPFHHLALPLGREAPRLTMQIDGRRRYARTAPDAVTMIQAGASGTSGWDGTMESACVYFTDQALTRALGLDGDIVNHDIRTRLAHHSPPLARLTYSLFLDAVAGKPHGLLVGDAIFVALASHLAPPPAKPAWRHGEPGRVRDALTFIHAHLTDELSITAIADAAATSPYYLNRCFRLALGCSIWRYVLRTRADFAMHLLGRDYTSLAAVAQQAGFETYPAFIAAFRERFGKLPSAARSP